MFSSLVSTNVMILKCIRCNKIFLVKFLNNIQIHTPLKKYLILSLHEN